jgi:hypothetical protein
MKFKAVYGIMLILLIFSMIGVNIIRVTAQETHDIAVVNVTASKTIVGRNYPMSITVTVENQGDYTETFNVTAYYGDDTINPGQWETFWSEGCMHAV